MHRMKSGTGDLKNHRSTLVKVGRRKVVRFARRLTTLRAERLERSIHDVQDLYEALHREVRLRLKTGSPLGFVPIQ